jgi:hypothetical protein
LPIIAIPFFNGLMIGWVPLVNYNDIVFRRLVYLDLPVNLLVNSPFTGGGNLLWVPKVYFL